MKRQIKIGPPATGDDFFPRPKIRQRLLRALSRGHAAFLGPRRTGKTSIIREIEDHPPEGTVAIYIDVEQFHDVPAWLAALINATKTALQTPPDGWLKKAGKGTVNWAKRIEEISLSGIKLTANLPATEQWLPAANQFLALLRESQIPIYFLIDEFPWFLAHLAQRHTPVEVEAVLNWFRQARQELADRKTRFLVTGSIGLGGLLRRLGLAPTANDFDAVDIAPLDDDEAIEFLGDLAEGEGLAISEAARRQIVKCLGANWPVLLELFVSEIQEAALAQSPTPAEIDALYEQQVVRGNRNKYCEEMYSRLAKLDFFSPSERRLATEILRDLCGSGQPFGRDRFLAIHERLVPEAEHRALAEPELDVVLDTLRHDGYLLRGADGLTRFASHILRDYWRHRTT